jgi:hypothetical protein
MNGYNLVTQDKRTHPQAVRGVEGVRGGVVGAPAGCGLGPLAVRRKEAETEQREHKEERGMRRETS